MRKRRGRNVPAMPHSEKVLAEQNLGELQGVLSEFRDSVFAEADRPDFFWIRQRNALMDRLAKPELPRPRRGLLWVPAAVVVLLCLLFLTKDSQAPPPDFAAGYDQNLLIEVERALGRNYPDALAPALLLIPVNDQNEKAAGYP